jgi:hypothetical protein
MKRTMIITALCLLASTGCVVTTEGEDSRVRVTWNLVAGDDNAPSACPRGVNTAAVVSEPVNDGDSTIGDGDEIYDLFDCAARIGQTGALSPGRYEVWVDIYDTADRLVAQSSAQVVDLGVGDLRDIVYDISLDHGSFGLSWTISDGARGLSCGQVNGREVWVASALVGPNGTTYDDLFQCVDGQAVTPALPLGVYDVGVTLVDGARQAMHEPLVIESSLDWGNAFVDLGSIEFALE